jgi:hypothetical protein
MHVGQPPTVLSGMSGCPDPVARCVSVGAGQTQNSESIGLHFPNRMQIMIVVVVHLYACVGKNGCNALE